MPYTRTTWDPSIPAGSGQVSAGDNELRALKTDLQERLESFFEDIDADPLEPKADAINALTAITGKKLIIGPHDGVFPEHDDEWSFDDNRVTCTVGGSGPAWRAPIHLPVGVRIKNIKVRVERLLTAGVDVKIKKVTADTDATASEVWTSSTSDAGITEIDSGAVDYEILDDNYYFLQINASNTYRFYSATITYDSPGLSAVR